MTQDCAQPLCDLIMKDDEEYERIEKGAKQKIDKLHLMDNAIKTTAMAYFKSAREAEECVAKFQRIKYDADLTYTSRK